MILNLVPNVATFRTTLRAIRLWAKSTSQILSELEADEQKGESTPTFSVSLEE